MSLLSLALRAWAAGCLAKINIILAKRAHAARSIGTLLVAAGLFIVPQSGLAFSGRLPAGVTGNSEQEQHLLNFSDMPATPSRRPRFSASAEKKLNPFRSGLYLKNQEYQAGLGFLAGMLFLLWKMLG